jgi:hypothetical protein
LLVGGQLVDEWAAEGASSTRRVIRGVALRPGDESCTEGMPDGGEVLLSITWRSCRRGIDALKTLT